jgi:hypothetical protein
MSETLLPRIRVSEQNPHLLATNHGEPFFWLGDTAWELFHRCTREEARHYFANRRQKGFNMIQAAALAEFDGLHTPNAYGELPLIGDDPLKPNEGYFGFVDELIALAADQSLYIGLLPTWGDKVHPQWGIGPAIFTADSAFGYGEWLGRRYREQTNLIWILGGDRLPTVEQHDFRPIWRALAAGIDSGTRGQALMTYHIAGGHSTSVYLHDESWLDINTMQSGHGSGHDVPVWDWIARDYARLPYKPTLDAEPNYEDHPVNPWPTWDPALGYFRDHDIRKQTYRSVFAGACGVTYGHHAVWQFCGPRYQPINHADRSWTEALDRPGAFHVGHLRRLMETRAYFTRVPDQGLLAEPAGAGGTHVQAIRDAQGSHAFVYVPNAGQSVTVDLSKLSGDSVRAAWFDPRTGAESAIGEFSAGGTQAFTTPAAQPETEPDWVLVLDRL